MPGFQRGDYDLIGNRIEVYSDNMLTGYKQANTATSLKFSPKYLDSENSLYYYGLRFYHPGLGRWISRDPMHILELNDPAANM